MEFEKYYTFWRFDTDVLTLTLKCRTKRHAHTQLARFVKEPEKWTLMEINDKRECWITYESLDKLAKMEEEVNG